MQQLTTTAKAAPLGESYAVAHFQLRVIDSHTAGEATRVVLEGGPPWTSQSPKEWRDLLERHYDFLRQALVSEPRGFPAMVGAWLGPPHSPGSTASVVFFNNAGYLGMCVHGTIGVAVTLRRLQRVGSGTFGLDTPVGRVDVAVHEDGSVSVGNVPSYRYRSDVTVWVPPYGDVTGDIAWGGNWFFLVHQQLQEISPRNINSLMDLARRIRQALNQQQITGAEGAEIDHIELFGVPDRQDCHSRNFVLCPGEEYDRSPCGTGTSAKIACLAAQGKLAPGQWWRQQGILGTYFDACYEVRNDQIFPIIKGSAHIVAEATIFMEEDDPFRFGIRL
jgi:4-hydroxyproline epimerase